MVFFMEIDGVRRIGKMKRLFTILLLFGVVEGNAETRRNVEKTNEKQLDRGFVEEDFHYDSSLDDTKSLVACVVYENDGRKHPIMILQPGYYGGKHKNLFSARRMARRGYFCILNERRGLVGNSGKHDDGGIEIMDIYDSLQKAVKLYRTHVDSTRIFIIGYSNGGGNVFFSSVRFPFLFRGAMAFFGIPDYGKWITLQKAFRAHVVNAVGGPPGELSDKYMARNSCLAAGNLMSGVRFHIAYDEEETLCPVAMDEAFIKAAQKAGVSNLFVHISGKHDSNRWIHGYNTNDRLSAAEDMFMDDVEANSREELKMPPSGELVVLGFIVTPYFDCLLGNGDDTVAKVIYNIENNRAEFQFVPFTSRKDAKVRLKLKNWANGSRVTCEVNGTRTNISDKDMSLEVICHANDSVVFTKMKIEN